MRRLRRAHQKYLKQHKRFKRTAVAAGTAAAITLAVAASRNYALTRYAPDEHELVVSEDTDGDLLADSEETALAYRVADPDQNHNEIPDGVELAKCCADVFNQLPDCGDAEPNDICKGFAQTFGLETCDICAETVNMGDAWVTNPRRGLTVHFPILALHYMEHGSFSYAGSVHDGRIDVERLLIALELRLPCEPNDHQLPVAQDADGDSLADEEEYAIGCSPFRPDQNANEIPDGIELARRCATVINQLPQIGPFDPAPLQTHKVEHTVWGVEQCTICGLTVNMGYLEIVNPQLGLTTRLPILSVHYMSHGSFSYDGTTNMGRVDISLLLRTLELPASCATDEHQLPVREDADTDLLADNEETAIGYRPFNPDQNHNEIADGVELAKRCVAVIRELPVFWIGSPIPPPNETYKVEHALDGLEQCDICGQWIHMGGWEIINPKLGLRYPDSNDPLDGMFLPDLALHYMEHGSFSCSGHVDDMPWHVGRVSIARLLTVLELHFPSEPNDHQLPVTETDTDGDLLTDSEELATGFDLHDADQDEDLTADGIELARQCAEVIDALPVYEPDTPGINEVYKADFMQRGIEYCEVCGASVNMGYWRVINPKLGLSIEVPVIVCHYMEHGSFSHSGDVHGLGRIDVALLAQTLEMPRRCGDLGTIYAPGDLDRDCKVDLGDFAKLADKWLQNAGPSQD